MTKLKAVMEPVVENARPLSAIRERLASIPGVERVIVDEGGVWLIRSARSDPAADLVGAANAVVREEGFDPDVVTVEVLPVGGDRNRVRFEGIERTDLPELRVRVRVALEWQGETFFGEAEGEKGVNIELRTAALAALDALDRVTEESVGVRLAGVKQVRAFDAELMVVSLYQTQPDFQKFLGLVLVGPDPVRASALAVLHALNRVLGNFLATR
ncbi:MAG TPA: hypothetical protein VMM79_17210 [Longimicrobiales bacterium]|nr:hypothetical protein [Longimicrobiales bacterium]